MLFTAHPNKSYKFTIPIPFAISAFNTKIPIDEISSTDRLVYSPYSYMNRWSVIWTVLVTDHPSGAGSNSLIRYLKPVCTTLIDKLMLQPGPWLPPGSRNWDRGSGHKIVTATGLRGMYFLTMSTGVSRVTNLGSGRSLWHWMIKVGAAVRRSCVTCLRCEFIVYHSACCVAVNLIFVAELQFLIYVKCKLYMCV